MFLTKTQTEWPSLSSRCPNCNYGEEKNRNVSANLSGTEDFCSRLEVLLYSLKASQHYDAIRANPANAGQQIGVNDVYIAAHARSKGLILVTKNVIEFIRVPLVALQIENWMSSE